MLPVAQPPAGGPKSGNHDLQRFSYTIWMSDDPHARACLACHSVQDKSRMLLPVAVLADGVGCASCHGDSTRWQQIHSQPN